MRCDNLGLYIPREKLNTGNLQEALNFFLEELEIDGVRFEVGLFKEGNTINFGIVLRNTLHLRDSVRQALSVLMKHKDVRVAEKAGTPCFNRTPYSDWDLWKDYNSVSDDMKVDEEE
jgi:hypothetical protein